MTEDEVKSKFAALSKLISENSRESEIQKFLELNPFMVTGFGGHVHQNIVISQLPLGNDFKTDFAWLDINSSGISLHLIEIESSALKIFNENGDFSQPYNHAIQQLKDWHHWTNRNQPFLKNLFEPLQIFGNHINVTCHLVAGRRSNMSILKNQRRYESLNEELPKWAHIQTWDGFVQRIPLARYAGSYSEGVRCVTYRNQDYFEKTIEDIIYD